MTIELSHTLYSWSGHLVAALLLGAGLGALYFGGLGLTIQRLGQVRSPELLLLGSAIARLCLALICFYAILTGLGLAAFLACLLGFFGMRTGLVRHWRPQIMLAAAGQRHADEKSP